MAVFSVSNIISALDVAPLQPAYFSVNIASKAIPNFDISLFCQNAILPGVQFNTTAVRQSGIGNIERRPTDVDFQDFSAAFIVDGRGEVVKFFQNWMQSIYKFDARDGISKKIFSLKTYTFEYPKNYEATITINQYAVGPDQGESGQNIKSIISYQLFRAFPHTIGNLNVSWDAQNEYHVLPVQFYYQSWSSNLLTPSETYDPTLDYKPSVLDFPKNNEAVQAAARFTTNTAVGTIKTVGAGVDLFARFISE